MFCSGHSHQHELLLYTENCLIILKNIFTSSTSTDERIAILYLMYAMYFKQPTKDFCKFRFTQNDWTKMKQFYNAISTEPKYLQARSIFWRLWQGNAFRFVEHDRELYPETMQFHRLGNDGLGDFQPINTSLIGQINALQNESNGLMSAIETLQVGYNEMKEHFKSSCDGTNLESIDVITGVKSQLQQIKKIFDRKVDVASRRRRNAMRRAETSKSAKFGESSKRSGDSGEALDTGIDSEIYEYSDLSDESALQSDDDVDDDNDGDADDDDENDDDVRCLQIGSKRYDLKRRALQTDTGELHRLRSCVVPSSSTAPVACKKETKQTDCSAESAPYKEKNPTSNDEDVDGHIVISYPKKVYNRHKNVYRSTARKQFIDYPALVYLLILNNFNINFQ